MIEEKKTKPSSKIIYIIIGIIIAILIMYFIGYFDNSVETYNIIKTELQNHPDAILPLFLSTVFFIVTIIMVVWIALKKPKVFEKIIETCKIFWIEIWAPFTVLIIMFLGWLHTNYPYESYFQENVTQSFSEFGNVTMSIYNYGTQFPGWGWAIIWILLFGFGIWNIIDVWRGKKEVPKETKTMLQEMTESKPKDLNTKEKLAI